MATKHRRQWLRQHAHDPFVAQAREQGLRSRAAYKLSQIDRRKGLLRRAMTVIDLGAAPGGWSQYAVERLGPQGHVIAVDVLPIDPIDSHVHIIQGDFCEPTTLRVILHVLGEHKADLVLSDMAPHISGISTIDQPRAIHLAQLAFTFAKDVLNPSGRFLVKLFQGAGFEDFLRETRMAFGKVSILKPEASRAHSREAYLLGEGLRSGPNVSGGAKSD